MLAPVYAYPILPNGGLGNRLFAWARCKVYSELNRVPMITPSWTQVKLGPMLRGERDWRWYTGEFQALPSEIMGWHKRRLLWTQPRLPEPHELTSLQAAGAGGIQIFSGWSDYFTRLNGQHGLIRRALESACQPRWMERVNAVPHAPMAMHVRRGDLKNAQGEFLTSLSWFESVVKVVRNVSGVERPIQLFSDGKEEEVAPLLRLPNVFRVNTGSAIGDLLAMARAKFLIASGGSTFSTWAGFLGQMPVLTPPGHPLSYYGLKLPAEIFSGEFDPHAAPPAAFIETLKRIE